MSPLASESYARNRVAGVDAGDHCDAARRPVLWCGGWIGGRPATRRYTQSMTTTIKVSNDVRDQLKGQAALAHRTLGQHLEYLASLGEREARMAGLRAAVKATSPEDLASYREETRAWDRIEND